MSSEPSSTKASPLAKSCADPYFPADNIEKFKDVYTVYGTKKLKRVLDQVNPDLKESAVNSLHFDASLRLQNPAYGSMALISSLQEQIRQELFSYRQLYGMLPVPNGPNHITGQQHAGSSIQPPHYQQQTWEQPPLAQENELMMNNNLPYHHQNVPLGNNDHQQLPWLDQAYASSSNNLQVQPYHHQNVPGNKDHQLPWLDQAYASSSSNLHNNLQVQPYHHQNVMGNNDHQLQVNSQIQGYEQHLVSYNNGGSGGDDTTTGLNHMTLMQTASPAQNLNNNAQTQLQFASNISPSGSST